MNSPGKNLVSRRVITFEIMAFLFIIAMIWLDEVIDIPYLLLGAPQTPVNWRESLFESVIILVLGTLITYNTFIMFKKMKNLEGILPVCASCKKIRDDKGSWNQIEVYVRDRSDAEFSHGICPDCAEKLINS